MHIPGADQAFKNLIDWSTRDSWKPLCTKIIDDHFAVVRQALGVEAGALAKELGDDYFSLAVGCALEDFLAHRFGDDKRNIIDDYLKRRGWRESVPGRRYLAALRDSQMSLYEVMARDPGHTLVLRDMLRGGDPVTVDDRRGSQTSAVGDHLGARVLSVNGKYYLGGGVLHFPDDVAGMLVATFNESVTAVKEHAASLLKDGEDPDTITPEQWRQVVVQRGAVVFTQSWLMYIVGATRRANAQPD
ncbi:MAG: hypothetical protein HQL37_02535 [Alphaproteobacteria bacterium]|nr:hypothetical protein [Alphaproteobacteria bacterium]